MEIQKEKWVETKAMNENFITNSIIQIEMAKKVIELCNEKIASFDSEIPKSI